MWQTVAAVYSLVESLSHQPVHASLAQLNKHLITAPARHHTPTGTFELLTHMCYVPAAHEAGPAQFRHLCFHSPGSRRGPTSVAGG